MKENWLPDPLLDEVDEARLEILAEHGNDHHKVWAHYVEEEKQYPDRLISYDETERKDQSAA